MTPQEAAEKLSGNQYREEGSRELFAEMKDHGLVAVFGGSDDLMEFRGAVYDEVGAYEGGEALFTPAGLFTNQCKDGCPYHERLAEKATPVIAKWDSGGFSWQYETTIPHAKFVIMEDDEPYCEGIVFALADVPNAAIEEAAQACYDVTTAAVRTALPTNWVPQRWDELQERERELHRNYARAARSA